MADNLEEEVRKALLVSGLAGGLVGGSLLPWTASPAEIFLFSIVAGVPAPYFISSFLKQKTNLVNSIYSITGAGLAFTLSNVLRHYIFN